MKRLPATRRRVAAKNGTVLYEETSAYEIEGDQVYEVTEVLVDLCPSCGSRLDQAKIVGQCWQCGIAVCSHCGSRAQCGRTLCDNHKHLALLHGEKLTVCAEHRSMLEEEQRSENLAQMREEARRTREREIEMDLKIAAMRLKEETTAEQIALRRRELALREETARFEAELACERLRFDKLRALAPTAYSMLRGGPMSG